MSKIVFRCDGSNKIGMGHVYKCLRIANKLRKHNILFITKDYDESINLILKNKFKIKKINKNISPKKEVSEILKILKQFKPELYVHDLYYFRIDYSKKLKKLGIKTILLDIVGKTKLKGDIIINRSDAKERIKKYTYDAKYFIGPKYAVLDDRFGNVRKTIKKKANNILVCFGGSDPKNFTIKTANALNKLPVKTTIITGPGYIHKKQLQDFIKKIKNITLKTNIKGLAPFLEKADIAI